MADVINFPNIVSEQKPETQRVTLDLPNGDNFRFKVLKSPTTNDYLEQVKEALDWLTAEEGLVD